MSRRVLAGGAALLALGVELALGAVAVVVERISSDDADPGFGFKEVPRPAVNDAATGARFELVGGRRDPNGGDLDCLHDGRVPNEGDAPRANFFFAAGTDGGKIQVDLGKVIAIHQVNTFSWHPGSRGPQVYVLSGSDGSPAVVEPKPVEASVGQAMVWQRIARVDSRPASGDEGGQHGVSVRASEGGLGSFRYLLFEVQQTREGDRFANTFFSEIDVVSGDGTSLEFVPRPAAGSAPEVVSFDEGRYRLIVDTSGTPDLADWVRAELVPMIRDWYPRLVRLLPSAGFEAPRTVRLVMDPRMNGVAATSGDRIRCAAGWIRANLKGEARGAVFHELVHVTQQYGRVRPGSGAVSPPGWLVEGIADYLRWYRFEPEAMGAEITSRNLSRARYDGSYRITANFLDWVSRKHGTEFVPKLNAAIREGRYAEALWREWTGSGLAELGAAWKAEHERRLGGATP